jgi:hypothetical protein
LGERDQFGEDRILAAGRGVAPAGGGVEVHRAAIGGQHKQRGRAGQLIKAEPPGDIQIAALARLGNADVDIDDLVG